jgi:hypothetical protein
MREPSKLAHSARATSSGVRTPGGSTTWCRAQPPAGHWASWIGRREASGRPSLSCGACSIGSKDFRQVRDNPAASRANVRSRDRSVPPRLLGDKRWQIGGMTRSRKLRPTVGRRLATWQHIWAGAAVVLAIAVPMSLRRPANRVSRGDCADIPIPRWVSCLFLRLLRCTRSRTCRARFRQNYHQDNAFHAIHLLLRRPDPLRCQQN